MAQNGTPLPETTVVGTFGLTKTRAIPVSHVGQLEKNMKRRTFSVSHQQHSVVDHPGVAEDLQRVGNPLPVELQFDKGNKNVLSTVSRMSEW